MPYGTPSWYTHLNPDPNPPDVTLGDVVVINRTIREDYGLTRERAVISNIERGGPYGECNARCCFQYQVTAIRSSQYEGVEETCYLRLRGNGFTLASPELGDLVTCDTPGNGGHHHNVHPWRDTCLAPKVHTDTLVAVQNEVLENMRNFLVIRAREQEQARAQFPLNRWYEVNRGIYVGWRFRPTRWEGDSSTRVRGTLMSSFDDITPHVMSVSDLGASIPAWSLSLSVPPELRLTQPRFAVTINNGDIVTFGHLDREMNTGPDPDEGPLNRPMSRREADDHECDDDCENYGCEYADDEDDVYQAVPYNPYGQRSLIHQYSYQPSLRFNGTGPLFLGVELELATPHAEPERVAEQAVEELGNLVYLKADCSISPQGFEMVHHPMDYDWAYANYPRHALRRLRAAGAHPDTSCGMHVHVSRNGFTGGAHTFKWMKWFYRNKTQVSTLARRRGSHYADFGDNQASRNAKFLAKGAVGGERYSAINAGNDATLEVRVFASTLNIRKLLAAMGLVDASARYAATFTASDVIHSDAWGFTPFKDYVHSFKKYAPLQQEMKRLGL